MRGLLLSEYFLSEGIEHLPEYRTLVAERAAVDGLLAKITDVFSRFPIAKQPNEAQTEDDLIKPILDLLGWDDRHRIVQPRGSRKGRSDVPDLLLFGAPAEKSKASHEASPADGFRHALVVGENKRWQRPLDRRGTARIDEPETPGHQMIRYLGRAEVLSDRRVRWGILTNGRLWRLYFAGAKSVSEEYLEVDLPALLDVPGLERDLFGPQSDEERHHALLVFLLMFRHSSFLPSGDGRRTLHEVALADGRAWEERVTKDLSKVVFSRVFPALVDGLHQAYGERDGLSDAQYGESLRTAALVLLYRLLFVMYAEDRDLLPVTDRSYADYSLRGLRDEVEERIRDGRSSSTRAAGLYAKFRSLCAVIDRGDASLGVPPYNGGLFSPDTAPVLARADLADAVFADVVDSLSTLTLDDRRRRVNYRDLSVQQLGSIYERILEFGVELNGEDGRPAVVDRTGGRHGSGSYYTPEPLVGLILERAVGPLLDARMHAFDARLADLAGNRRAKGERIAELQAVDPADAFLDLKVCDPAMGSGHFLVSLVDYLATRVLAAMEEAPAKARAAFADPAVGYVSPVVIRIEAIRAHIVAHAKANGWRVDEKRLDDRHLVRRMILKRVVHGVDKNPMAVELAKVALWLHTFTSGAPLSFLDHHLRTGDSLLGTTVGRLMRWGESRGKLITNRYVAPVERAANVMLDIEAITDANIAETEASKHKFDAVAEETRPLAAYMSMLQAVRASRVLDDAPTESEAKLRLKLDSRSTASERARKRAREDLDAVLRAKAMQEVLDGVTYGDPVRIATGEIEILRADERVQLGLSMDEDALEQASLFGDGAPDDRQRLRADDLVRDARAFTERHRPLHWEIAFPNVWRDWMSNAPRGGFDAVIGNPPFVRQEELGEIKPVLKADYETYDGVADLYVYFYELGLRLLKPGGRLSYVVTNKWLKAGYAEALRGLFADRAWMELVVDFGHAKQFFHDADVFPCVVVAARPDGSEPPSTTLACVIPREDVAPADLIKQVAARAYPMPRLNLGRSEWMVEPQPVARLMAKLRERGTQLVDYAGTKPYRGVLTGYNEAFLIDTRTRDRLVANDPNSAEIIKKYLRGQDIERWHAPWRGEWMIFARRGIDIDLYPAVRAHLDRYRHALEPKPEGWKPRSGDEEWPGRKAGNYKWYELQDSAEYWKLLELPKIMYQEIQFYPRFSIDKTAHFINNTIFCISSEDPWLAVALNSPLLWWFNWRHLMHGKDEALRPFGYKMEVVPIAPLKAKSRTRHSLESDVDRLESIARQMHEGTTTLADWYRAAFEIAKPPQSLLAPWGLDVDGFVAAMQTTLGKRRKLSPGEVKHLRQAWTEVVRPIRESQAERDRLERRLSDLVNQSYGLTPEEVAVMWETAPPRMPLSAP